MIPGGAQLPVFDPDVQHRIAVDFQAKLLSFRRANLSAACKLRFDSWKFVFSMRELAHDRPRGNARTTPSCKPKSSTYSEIKMTKFAPNVDRVERRCNRIAAPRLSRIA